MIFNNGGASVNVVNNLLETVEGSALDATQGKVLDDKITMLGANIQCGTAQFSDGTCTVTFPKPFANPPKVFATPRHTSASNVMSIKVNNTTNESTKFTGVTSSKEGAITLMNATFDWLAIGL